MQRGSGLAGGGAGRTAGTAGVGGGVEARRGDPGPAPAAPSLGLPRALPAASWMKAGLRLRMSSEAEEPWPHRWSRIFSTWGQAHGQRGPGGSAGPGAVPPPQPTGRGGPGRGGGAGTHLELHAARAAVQTAQQVLQEALAAAQGLVGDLWEALVREWAARAAIGWAGCPPAGTHPTPCFQEPARRQLVPTVKGPRPSGRRRRSLLGPRAWPQRILAISSNRKPGHGVSSSDVPFRRSGSWKGEGARPGQCHVHRARGPEGSRKPVSTQLLVGRPPGEETREASYGPTAPGARRRLPPGGRDQGPGKGDGRSLRGRALCPARLQRGARAPLLTAAQQRRGALDTPTDSRAERKSQGLTPFPHGAPRVSIFREHRSAT